MINTMAYVQKGDFVRRTDTEKIRHWKTTVPTTNVQPCLEMLDPEGYIIVRACKISGEKKLGKAPVRRVRYNRDYVVHWLKVRFLQSFWCTDTHVLMELFSEAVEAFLEDIEDAEKQLQLRLEESNYDQGK